MVESFLVKSDHEYLKRLEKIRWNNCPECPYCHSKRYSTFKNSRRYRCNTCNTSFSATVGTVFHHTRLPLGIWVLGVNLILNSKSDISSREMAEALKVNKNTGLLLLQKIRRAFFDQEQRKLLQEIANFI